MKTVTYDETKYKLVPIEPSVEMTNCGAPHLTGLTSYAYPITNRIFAAMLAAAPEAPEVEPEPVNKQLLDTLRRARKYVFSYARMGGLLIAIDDAISAAEQRQTEPAPELTDTEITAIEKTCWGYEAFSWDDRLYLNHVKFARAVIAADRAKRGV